MLICCVILVISQILDQQCHAVVGGREAVPHSRPYMAFIEIKTGSGQTHYCAGFLLNEDFVMTAAHCQAESYIVSLGVHKAYPMNDEVQNISVEQAFPHKSFNQSTNKNDVMLLKLVSKAKINNRVAPITISGQDEGCQPKSCSVAGWGQAFSLALKLMEVDVTLIDEQICVEKDFYCSTGFNGPGQGDAGSPLVCDGYAHGVTSSMSSFNSNLNHVYAFSKLPDSRNLADLFLDHRPVCGRTAD